MNFVPVKHFDVNNEDHIEFLSSIIKKVHDQGSLPYWARYYMDLSVVPSSESILTCSNYLISLIQSGRLSRDREVYTRSLTTPRISILDFDIPKESIVLSNIDHAHYFAMVLNTMGQLYEVPLLSDILEYEGFPLVICPYRCKQYVEFVLSNKRQLEVDSPVSHTAIVNNHYIDDQGNDQVDQYFVVKEDEELVVPSSVLEDFVEAGFIDEEVFRPSQIVCDDLVTGNKIIQGHRLPVNETDYVKGQDDREISIEPLTEYCDIRDSVSTVYGDERVFVHDGYRLININRRCKIESRATFLRKKTVLLYVVKDGICYVRDIVRLDGELMKHVRFKERYEVAIMQRMHYRFSCAVLESAVYFSKYDSVNIMSLGQYGYNSFYYSVNEEFLLRSFYVQGNHEYWACTDRGMFFVTSCPLSCNHKKKRGPRYVVCNLDTMVLTKTTLTECYSYKSFLLKKKIFDRGPLYRLRFVMTSQSTTEWIADIVDLHHQSAMVDDHYDTQQSGSTTYSEEEDEPDIEYDLVQFALDN